MIDDIGEAIKDGFENLADAIEPLTMEIASLSEEGELILVFSSPIHLEYPQNATYYEEMLDMSLVRGKDEIDNNVTFSITNFTSELWIIQIYLEDYSSLNLYKVITIFLT